MHFIQKTSYGTLSNIKDQGSSSFFSYYCCFVIYVQIAYEYSHREFRVVHYNVAHLRNLRLQAMTNFNRIFSCSS